MRLYLAKQLTQTKKVFAAIIDHLLTCSSTSKNPSHTTFRQRIDNLQRDPSQITSKARCLSLWVVALLSWDLLCGVEDDRPLSVLDCGGKQLFSRQSS